MNNALRARLNQILEVSQAGDKASRCADIFLIGLICLNVIALMLESVDAVAATWSRPLYLFELFSVVVFSIEYLLRLWSSVELDDAKYKHPFWGRLRYMLSPMALIDLLAILPFYMILFIPMDLRFLRVIRILRIFKLTRYSSAVSAVLSVLQEEANAFLAAFFVMFMLLILASSGIYLIEQDVQPEAFGSIPAAMWWAMATLTTVGYGDVTPITPLGKVFGGFVTIIGVGMVALPAGILASGFSDQLRRRREQYNLKLDEALEDGVITSEEEHELNRLRKELALTREEARVIRESARKSASQQRDKCPHCQMPL